MDFIKNVNNCIDRPIYLEKLVTWKNKNIVKVLTGIRRSGKSSILQSFAQKLIADGVNPQSIIYKNFEDFSEANKSAHEIYNELDVFISANKEQMIYIFFDEIQKITAWEKIVASLLLKKNVDIYITGSNAYLLSSELATFLSGRYIEIKVLPLSFKEFLSFYSFPENETLDSQFNKYVQFGGMPSLKTTDLNPLLTHDTLEGIYNTVLVKDVLTRLPNKNIELVQKIIHFLADNIANITSINSITNTLFAAKSISVKNNTIVENIITALENAYIFYKVKRYDIKGKDLLRNFEKYYLVDPGLRYYVLNRLTDSGRLLENIVYFELLRRGWQVNIGKIKDQEIDFIASKMGSAQMYIQVCETMLGEETRNRELNSLRKIPDNFPKMILTTDHLFTGVNEDGIKIMNIVDWLLSDNLYDVIY